MTSGERFALSHESAVSQHKSKNAQLTVLRGFSPCEVDGLHRVAATLGGHETEVASNISDGPAGAGAAEIGSTAFQIQGSLA